VIGAVDLWHTLFREGSLSADVAQSSPRLGLTTGGGKEENDRKFQNLGAFHSQSATLHLLVKESVGGRMACYRKSFNQSKR
jgi:hypothetical protein